MLNCLLMWYILKVSKAKEDRAMKTAKQLINEVLDIAEIAQKKGNHEAYRKCMELIADIIYEANVQEAA